MKTFKFVKELLQRIPMRIDSFQYSFVSFILKHGKIGIRLFPTL